MPASPSISGTLTRRALPVGPLKGASPSSIGAFSDSVRRVSNASVHSESRYLASGGISQVAGGSSEISPRSIAENPQSITGASLGSGAPTERAIPQPECPSTSAAQETKSVPCEAEAVMSELPAESVVNQAKRTPMSRAERRRISGLERAERDKLAAEQKEERKKVADEKKAEESRKAAVQKAERKAGTEERKKRKKLEDVQKAERRAAGQMGQATKQSTISSDDAALGTAKTQCTTSSRLPESERIPGAARFIQGKWPFFGSKNKSSVQPELGALAAKRTTETEDPDQRKQGLGMGSGDGTAAQNLGSTGVDSRLVSDEFHERIEPIDEDAATPSSTVSAGPESSSDSAVKSVNGQDQPVSGPGDISHAEFSAQADMDRLSHAPDSVGPSPQASDTHLSQGPGLPAANGDAPAEPELQEREAEAQPLHVSFTPDSKRENPEAGDTADDAEVNVGAKKNSASRADEQTFPKLLGADYGADRAGESNRLSHSSAARRETQSIDRMRVNIQPNDVPGSNEFLVTASNKGKSMPLDAFRMGDVPKKLPALNMAAAPTYTVPGGFHFNAQKVTFEILFSPESFDRFIDRLLPEVFPPDWAPQNEAEKEENLHRKFGGLGLDAQNLIRHSGITVNAPTVEISLRVDPRLTVRKGSAPDVYTLRAEERPGRRSHISFDAGRSSDASESESESESEFEFESGHVSTGPVAAMKGGLPSWERGGRYGARRAQSAAGDAGNNIFRETPALVAVGAQSIPANTVWPAVTEGVGTSGAGTRSLGVADTARRRSAPDVSVNSATSSQWVRTLSHDASRERRNSVDGGGSDASPLPSPLDATSLAASQSESLADEFIDLSLVGGHANAGLAATTQPGILAVNEEDSWTPGALSAASANAVNRSGGTQPAVAMPGGANREPIAPTFMPLNIVARASVAGEIGASRVPKYRDGALRERIKKQALAKVDLAMHPVIESVLAQLDLALPERRLRLKMKGVTPYEEALPEAGELVRNS